MKLATNRHKRIPGVLAIILMGVGQMSAEDILLRDALGGAMVWRPYKGRVDWSGGKDGEGFASGDGSLQVFDPKGEKTVAVITGTMRRGIISGHVEANYPQSKDRASYSGEFSNWSENGRGTMTFRNGAVVSGVWKDGKMAAELVGGNGEEHDADPELQRRIDVAGKNLQTEYDNFKKALDANSAEFLTKCQRAWIKYDEAMLSLPGNFQFRDDDPRRREMILDELLTIQRTKEIRAISDWIFRGNSAGLGLEAGDPNAKERLRVLIERISQTNENGSVALQGAINSWGEASQISALIQLRESDNPSTQEMWAAFRQIQFLSLEQALKSWFDDDGMPPAVGLVADKPALPEYSDSMLADANELADIISGVTNHWLDAGKAGNWPDVLPAPLAEKLATFKNTELSDIRATNDFLRTWKTDAAAAMAAWSGVHQSSQTSPAISKWAEDLRKTAEKKLSESDVLRDQAAERLATGKSSLAASKIHEASKIAPREEDSSVLTTLEAYETLLKYSGGVEGQELPIPPTSILEASINTSTIAIELGDGNLGKAATPYAKALRIAPLLKEFSKISDPGPDLPRRPVKAYAELHGTSEWLSVASDEDPRTKALAPMLEQVTAALGQKYGEYRKLVEEADALSAAAKFSEAAKAYRNAFAIEPSPEIAAKIKTCESRLSGL